ncbi:MAG TPA: hypothetical protein VFH68_23475 [Polyangia bacterium]|jgi:hypothetical protein|nr:hypothetical protein [Polyangia bacterium]
MSASTEIISYAGWARNLRIANDDVELVVTLDVGPRVIRYATRGGENQFGESPDQLGKSGETRWMPRGGHRLWIAPEDKTRTYAPDNRPIEHQVMTARPGQSGAQVRLVQGPDQPYGVQKEIEIALAGSGSQVTVVHRIGNVGARPIEVSPWALTVMPPGGTAIVPLPEKRPHPGSIPGSVDADYWPNQTIALWSYLDLKDPRLMLGTRFITVRQDPRATTLLKFGLSHAAGWLGYWRDGGLFVKSIDYQAGKLYPDRGCNFELYTDPNILEVETLGPLVTLAPGEKTEHVETWRLFTGVAAIGDEASIAQNVATLAGG